MPLLPALVPAALIPSGLRGRTMKIAILEGCVWSVYANWLLGPITIGYLSHLGADTRMLALAGSIPFLSQMVGPFSAWLSGKISTRRKLMFYLGIFSRVAGLLPILATFPFIPLDGKITLVLLSLVLAHVFQSASGLLWQGIMSDVVPEKVRGRYFGYRNGLSGVFTMAASVGAGLLIDHIASPDSYRWLFVAALGMGVFSVLLYLSYLDPNPDSPTMRFREGFTRPLRDREFLPFVKTTVMWSIVQALLTVLVVPYLLQKQHLSMTQIGIYTALASLTTLFTNYGVGLVIDRCPPRRVLQGSILLSAVLLPVVLVLLDVTHQVWLVWVLAALEAVIYNTVNLSLFDLGVKATHNKPRVGYYALNNLLNGSASFLAGLAAGWSVSLLEHWTSGAYLCLFIGVGLLRLLLIGRVRV
ncbi:MFS transporter [Deinococcus roseus]|uniref:MFS transporter n=1 Tax=Deinococcus roseus TaxID=392414 RepID=A0ABQ2DCN1_9DEIO|nr:MFS transporter [Deinococcus roseus]GGJ53740.1 hypothetical protein GCM10008938_44700 [Deinococcus roseus]